MLEGSVDFYRSHPVHCLASYPRDVCIKTNSYSAQLLNFDLAIATSSNPTDALNTLEKPQYQPQCESFTTINSYYGTAIREIRLKGAYEIKEPSSKCPRVVWNGFRRRCVYKPLENKVSAIGRPSDSPNFLVVTLLYEAKALPIIAKLTPKTE